MFNACCIRVHFRPYFVIPDALFLFFSNDTQLQELTELPRAWPRKMMRRKIQRSQLILLLPREEPESPFCFPNPRYLRKERNGARFARRKWRTWKRTAENERKNHSPARPPGYPWGLVRRRCSTLAGHVWATTTGRRRRRRRGGRGCVGVWRKASARQPLRFLPRCQARQIGLYATSSSVRSRVFVAHTRARLIRTRRCSRARARIAGIRGIRKIPTAHVTTNCCPADRPTQRRSVKL